MEIYAGRTFPRARDVAMSERYVAWATGQSVVVEDRRTGEELFRVKKLSYMYWVDIVPDESMLIVHGTIPAMYFYALPSGALIRRIRLGKGDGAQDSPRAIDPAGRFMIYPLHTSDCLQRILRIDLKTLAFQTIDELSGRWRLAEATRGQDGVIDVVGEMLEERFERVRLVDGVPAQWQDLSPLKAHLFPGGICFAGGQTWCVCGGKLRRIGAQSEILGEISLKDSDVPLRMHMAGGLLWGVNLAGFTAHDPETLEILFRYRSFGGVLRIRELADGQVLISLNHRGAFIADIRF